MLSHATLEVDEAASPLVVDERDHGFGLLHRPGTEAQRSAETLSVCLRYRGPKPLHLLDGPRKATE